MIDFSPWTNATANLPAGVQRAFLNVLGLASEGKIKLNYGSDNYGGGACLVNQARNMLVSTTSPSDTPSSSFPAVVSAFDKLNVALRGEEVNDTSKFVTPLAAETLIRNFGQLKPLVIEVDSNPIKPVKYIEPSDDTLMEDWLNSIKEAPAEDTTPVVSRQEGEVSQSSTPFTG